ncbi:MAG: BamA/TamA family outer membrane protein [Gemmatimonadetes bacterium]|uniref:BamA/TamA family outer membrane protein n=1 Tax=Candidatus Kutchimonas denitrificans TaxID=3056748 RepID=A0AAE4Z7F3_9BACT|nr:BamA/TamA family outer membrane protein [Gemmatimonadota bacterium]NIR74993.1 BamA/TamA family outer membrane protein [Candidatus Kutchimonas denitrificans]NIS01576.1 BamA/TamA family outer membrane protein [Gemmatimonadota bacterium]NIT67314.1 BamA/TamA family outer membrane protein [Gemmatimonadota bacterium]NIU52677.1 BamA/TamA family outer membrane protein [Gemmatimonadota bacterium]
MSSRRGRRRHARAALAPGSLAAFLLLMPMLAEPACAQFGRNKLQHQVFDFEILQTTHFDIYYYPREREAALDAARMAERAYIRLSRILAHEFEERKPIILYASHSEFQQTNALPGFISEGTGGVTEFTKRRIILPFTGSYADFEHVLTHEMVHAFQYDVIARGLASQLNPLEFQPPLWFFEGMAEYLSVGGVDTNTEAWLRDAVLTGYLRTIPEMNRYSDYLSYRFGQSLWAYIGGKYGDQTIGLLLQRTMRLGLEGALRVTIGKGMGELSEEWIETIRTTYLPDVARHGRAGEAAQSITTHAFRPGSGDFASYLAPALSPDGRRIVYLSDRGHDLYSFFDLWLASAETGKVEARLVKAARDPDFESLRFMSSSAAWSNDGRYLAFVAKTDGRDAIYLYSVERRRVTRRIEVDLDGIQNPSFSPDGLWIAFTGLRGGISDLYMIDANGQRFQQLTDDKYADLHPAWSPDGEFIAIATDRGDDTDFDELVFGNFRIALYNVGRGDLELLPFQEEGKNINPVWSPDGSSIAFISDRSGINNVYILALGERRLYQVTDLLSGVSGIVPLSPAVSWAAGTDRLAFSYFEGAGYNIYMIDDPRTQAWPIEAPPADPPIAGAGLGTADGSPPLELAPAGERARSFYRLADEFRLSATPPVAQERPATPREVTVADLLADAELGLPDTASFQERDYRVKLSPDIVGQPVIGAQVGGFFGNGVYGGSYILLSDMLGDHNVLLWGQIAGSFEDAYILTQYTYLRERANLSMAYQQFPLYRFFGTVPNLNSASGSVFEDRFLRDVYRILSTDLHYPLNTFQRLEFSAVGFHVSRDSVFNRIVTTGTSSTNDRQIRPLEDLVFAGPAVAVVWDNALYGYTGPIAGRRYRIGVGRYFGDVQVTDLTFDFRQYFNLGGQWVFATRLTTTSRTGRDEREFRLYWGGPYFIRGYDGGSFSVAECSASLARVEDLEATLCPVRDQLIGSGVAFASAELRFPIFNFLDLGFAPLGLPPLDAVFFFDVGAAFNRFDQLVWSRGPEANPWTVRQPVAGFGAGLRMNIAYTVLRVDYSVPLHRPDKRGLGVWSIAFGPTF